MEYTDHLKLAKFAESDKFRISPDTNSVNANMEILDGAFADLESAIGDINEALAAAGLVIYNSQFYINPDGNSLPT